MTKASEGDPERAFFDQSLITATNFQPLKNTQTIPFREWSACVCVT